MGRLIENTEFNQMLAWNSRLSTAGIVYIGKYVKEYKVTKSMQVKDGVTSTTGRTTFTKIGYKRKIEITTNYLTEDQFNTLSSTLNSFDGYWRYYDPFRAQTLWIKGYITDLTAPLYMYDIDGDTMYSPMSFKIVGTEVDAA